MPTSLPKHPALLVRDVLTDNWTASNAAGYDPTLTPSDPNFLPLSRGWYSVGEHDPYVALSNFGEGVLGGGQTGYSAVRVAGYGADYGSYYGSGGYNNVQLRDGTGTITVFAEREQTYNGERAVDVVDAIRTEIERIPFEDFSEGDHSLGYLSTSLGGANTDTDPTTPVEMQTVTVTYGWARY